MTPKPLLRFTVLLFLAATLASQGIPTIPNASFEEGSHAAPGYGIIPGWSHSALGMGLNTSSGPFANNGTIPNGNQVAFIQTNSASLTLSTTISGLTEGTLYRVTFRANSRSGYASPVISVFIDDPALLNRLPLSMNSAIPSGSVSVFPASQVPTTQYHTLQFTFTAQGPSALLGLRSSSVGDGALLMDDFTIVPAQITANAWTNDASSGISREATRWAYNFGTSQTTTINGVEIPGIANPTGAFSNTDFQIQGLTTTQAFNSNNLTGVTGQGTAILGRDFSFGPGTAPRGQKNTLTLKGLAAGRSYTLSLFTFGWGPDGLPFRLTTFETTGGEKLTLSPSLFGSNSGLRVDIRFTAAGTEHVITATVANDNNATFHYCGLALKTDPIFVTNLDDSGPGSLRDALARAASIPGLDKIFFDPSLDGGTITLNEGADRSALTVDDPAGVVVDASDLAGGITLRPGTSGYRAFEVAGGSSLELVGLGISGFNTFSGEERQSAGAILNGGTLVLTRCDLSGNEAELSGGAIQNLGWLTLTDCTLTGNRAGGLGGAIRNDAIASLALTDCDLTGNTANVAGGAIHSFGSLTLAACRFARNQCEVGTGGAIHHEGDGVVSLPDCSFSENSARFEGGAIFRQGGRLELTDCSLTGNTAEEGGGAIHLLGGDLELTDCTLTGNTGFQGGAIRQEGFGLALTRCNLSGNSASDSGGAIFKQGGTLDLSRSSLGGNSSAGSAGAIRIDQATGSLTQCTLSANTASSGGAIDATGNLTLTLRHCTLSANVATGPGGAITCGGTLNLVNSIVARNTAPTGPNLLGAAGGSIVLQGTNLIDDLSGSNLGAPLGIVGGDPLLALLADYGGPTPTMALRPGSPARNAATVFEPALVTADQRGFPLVGQPDIGAYEAGHFSWPNLATELAENLPNTGPASGVRPEGDFDGDGVSNEDEIGFGTDMQNRNSFFRPATTLNGAVLTFRFQTRLDRSYHLQWSETLGGDWTTLESISSQVGEGTFSVAYPTPGHPKRFYRVMVSKDFVEGS